MPEFNFLESLPVIAPEIGLTILAIVVLLLEAYLPESQRRNIAYVAALGMAGLAITPFIWSPPAGSSELYWGGMLRFDALGQIFDVMVLLAGALTALLAIDDKGVRGKGEFHLIVIIATLGGALLAGSADLIMVFIALETLTIPLYVLAAFRRTDTRSAESGLKYFLFGGFASALLLYGFSFLFGFAGTTSLDGIAAALATGAAGENLIPVLAALVLIIAGFGFKIGAVPFHFWTPDVYEGAPTPVVAFISVASKAASLAVMMRFLVTVFPDSVVIDGQTVESFWVNLIVIVSIVSMTFGNVLALRQTNIKRLLAYSSIAQAGYALIGVAALQSANMAFGLSSVAFYMFMYTFSNILMFAGVIIVSEMAGTEKIAEYAGLQRRNPWLALAMTIALLSLAGIPPAAGFFGKLFLFQAAVEANLVGLAIIGVLNSIVALYYYLIVIKIMYVDKGADDDKAISISRSYGWVLGITGVVVLILGIIPTPVINWARAGAEALASTILGL